MKSSTHLRNAAIAVLVVVLIFLSATQSVVVPVQAQQAIVIAPTQPTLNVDPGSTASTIITITNSNIPGAADRNFTLSFSNTPSGLTPSSSGTIFITAGSSQQVTLFVTAAANVPPGSYTIQTTVTGAATGSAPQIQAQFPLTVVVSGSTFTPTPTNTPSPAPATATPTTGPVCADGFEPDNNPASSRPIDVQTSQLRTICGVGDEDWLVFGGVSGKVYTIDISRMDPGLDLTLELFDRDLNSIAFNNDFFNRDPSNPNPADTRPRITIRIPFDGPYYIRVRDAAGRGGIDYFYVIALIDESYGPTPTLVREVCLDLFEPDGLPEQGRLITSNELQENRALCPEGDADWVVFFGSRGKRYVIFTDTRRYRGRNEVNGVTQAGADTVIVLTDRDGVTILDVNDDIPGGNTLDSQIEFIPEVDGFYFVQVKNVGDIGNQFIRYDLTLLLCLPEQTSCGRPSSDPAQSQPVDQRTPAPTATPADEFVLEPTNTPQPTPTNTPVP
jgi:hypothetical protein